MKKVNAIPYSNISSTVTGSNRVTQQHIVTLVNQGKGNIAAYSKFSNIVIT